MSSWMVLSSLLFLPNRFDTSLSVPSCLPCHRISLTTDFFFPFLWFLPFPLFCFCHLLASMTFLHSLFVAISSIYLSLKGFVTFASLSSFNPLCLPCLSSQLHFLVFSLSAHSSFLAWFEQCCMFLFHCFYHITLTGLPLFSFSSVS